MKIVRAQEKRAGERQTRSGSNKEIDLDDGDDDGNPYSLPLLFLSSPPSLRLCWCE